MASLRALQSDATPNFFPDSKSSILGLSNEVSFVSRFFCKIAENWEKEESITWPNLSNWGKLYHAKSLQNLISKSDILKKLKTDHALLDQSCPYHNHLQFHCGILWVIQEYSVIWKKVHINCTTQIVNNEYSNLLTLKADVFSIGIEMLLQS